MSKQELPEDNKALFRHFSWWESKVRGKMSKNYGTHYSVNVLSQEMSMWVIWKPHLFWFNSYDQGLEFQKYVKHQGHIVLCYMDMYSFDYLTNITTQSVASPHTPHLSMIPIMTFTFELWPPKSKWFTMLNTSAKFDEEAHNGLVCIRFTAYFHTCPLWHWPLISDLQNK